MTAKPDDDYLWDRSGEDPEVARLEELLAPLQHRAPLDELHVRRRSRLPWLAGTVVAAAAAAIALVLLWPRGGDDRGGGCVGLGMVFSTSGTVTCNGEALAVGVLPIHGELATGAHEAELAIADIGTAKLGAHTIVRLDQTAIGKRHQLFLQEGTLHAKVTAPPKIFAVATPSADVTDLGCEYTLEIDRRGAGTIQVLSGKVELETGKGAVVLAPAGTHARLLPGRRASLPLIEGASPALERAVGELEADQPGALGRVLSAATRADVITVANLARVVTTEAARRTVLDKLATLVAAPQCLTIDEALADPDLLEMWLDEAYLVHLGASDGLPSKRCAPPP